MPSETLEPSSSRVAWIQEAGKEVLWVNLSRASVPELLASLEDFERAFTGRPHGSVLLLMDLQETHYSPSVSARWKSAAKAADAAYLKASAVYGASGIVGVALRGYLEALRLVGRPLGTIGVFKARTEALAWLLQH